MTRHITLFIIILSNLGSIAAQNKLEYWHKSLIKELQKVGISDISSMSEIPLPNDVTESISGQFFSYNKPNSSPVSYVYVGRVNSCRAGGCSAPQQHIGHSEYFDYFILFDASKSIYSLKIFNYQASHGYEITAKGWLKQFIGYQGRKRLEVNNDIDAISGATVSVYAITKDINEKTRLLNAL